MQEYQKVIDRLTECLMGKKTEKDTDAQIFKACLKELKTEYGKTISKKFLSGLMGYALSEKQKQKRISYLIFKSELKIKKTFDCFREWVGRLYKADITEYVNNKKGEVVAIHKGSVDVGKVSLGRKNRVFYNIVGF